MGGNMKNHTEINISNDHLKYEHGFNIIDLPNGDRIWQVSPSPESDTRKHVSFGMCGVQATRIVSDIELSMRQVIYLFSRLRSPTTSERSNHKICMWVAKTGLFIAIGEHLWEHKFNSEGRYDRDLFNQWVDIALQETFE